MKGVSRLLIVSGDSLILCAHWNHLDFRCWSEQLSKSASQRTRVRSVFGVINDVRWDSGKIVLFKVDLGASFAFMPAHGALRHFIKLAMRWSWEILQHLLMTSSSSMWKKKIKQNTFIWISMLTAYWSWDDMLLMLLLVSVQHSEVRAKSIVFTQILFLIIFFKLLLITS